MLGHKSAKKIHIMRKNLLYAANEDIHEKSHLSSKNITLKVQIFERNLKCCYYYYNMNIIKIEKRLNS